MAILIYHSSRVSKVTNKILDNYCFNWEIIRSVTLYYSFWKKLLTCIILSFSNCVSNLWVQAIKSNSLRSQHISCNNAGN